MTRTLRWLQVDSTAIKGVAYDRDTKVLHVLFQHGGLYSYTDVTTYRYQKLIHADSIGQYFNKYIKPKEVRK